MKSVESKYNLYEYTVTHVAHPETTESYRVVSETPPPYAHKLILEKLFICTKNTPADDHANQPWWAVVLKEHAIMNGTTVVPNDFDVVSPVFTDYQLARKFARIEFGAEWYKIYNIVGFSSSFFLHHGFIPLDLP